MSKTNVCSQILIRCLGHFKKTNNSPDPYSSKYGAPYIVSTYDCELGLFLFVSSDHLQHATTLQIQEEKLVVG